MAWIKTVGCNCPGCGADPCDDTCCTMSQIDKFQCTDGSATITNVYDVSADFGGISKDITVEFVVDFTGGSASLSVEADGVEIYNSGCIDGSNSQVVSVPADTANLTAIVVQNCSGVWVDNCWTYQLAC